VAERDRIAATHFPPRSHSFFVTGGPAQRVRMLVPCTRTALFPGDSPAGTAPKVSTPGAAMAKKGAIPSPSFSDRRWDRCEERCSLRSNGRGLQSLAARKRADTESAVPVTWRISAIRRTAMRECPPGSKKLSRIPLLEGENLLPDLDQQFLLRINGLAWHSEALRLAAGESPSSRYLSSVGLPSVGCGGGSI